MTFQKNIFTALLFLFSFLFSIQAYAAVEPQANVKIMNMTSLNDDTTGTGAVYLFLSNDLTVFIPKQDKLNTSLALTAFAAGKKVTIWNYTAATKAPKTFWKGPGIGDGATTNSLAVQRIDISTNQ